MSLLAERPFRMNWRLPMVVAAQGSVSAMDSQHRHELHQNDLRQLTTKAVPFVEKYAWQLVGGTVAAIAAFFGLAIWLTESSAATTEGWAQFDRVLHESNPTAGDFDEVAQKHPNSVIAGWARLKEADDYLKSGLREAFTNYEVSQSELKKGLEAYQKLAAGGAGVSSEIRERALYGLARCQEALSDGKTDDAVASYQRLLKEFPDTCFEAIATERIKELETPQAKDFYAWFHEQKPKPKEPLVNPFKKRAGDVDSLEGSLKDAITDDEAAAAETKSETKSETDKPATETPATETPATEEAKKSEPTQEKPAGEEPKPETPESKPADDAKAADSP